ncbi:O-antigen ligase family protein [Burkholderia multivorans]|uniref:O-antigen ligase family protein n=1 Tax=Burkholderia multivorans TaxID=87883 RepID=UPI0020B35EA3|nr:O-antigen ligase family protein [Burkholderia multivorans]
MSPDGAVNPIDHLPYPRRIAPAIACDRQRHRGGACSQRRGSPLAGKDRACLRRRGGHQANLNFRFLPEPVLRRDCLSSPARLPSRDERPPLAAVAAYIVIAAAPLFLVTIRGWSSAVLFVAALCAAVALAQRRASPFVAVAERPATMRMAIVLLLPVASILISSAFRGKFAAPMFDSPSRFAAAIPILLLVVHYRFSVGRWLQYTIPLGLLMTFVQLHFFEGPHFWDGDRMATYFADPLTFGQYMMTLGLMSLASINLFGKDRPPLIAFKCVAAAFGFYLSIRSGSRTGWLAMPIVIAYLALPRHRQLRARNVALALGVVAVLLISSYEFSQTVRDRIDAAQQDYASYHFSGIAPDTSAGLRITFLRIGTYLAATHPLGGLGDTGFESALKAPELAAFASPYARSFALHAGFHNELMTNAVRSGIWGILSTLALFIVPMVIFVRAIRSPDRDRVANGTMGLVFMICQIVSGMTTEVFNLKFTASFSAIFIAALCGASIIRYGKE